MKNNTPDKLEEIRKAALKLLEREDPESVSMRRVAKAAGVTAMAIYHYYPSRKALLDEITSTEFEKQAATLAAVSTAGSIEERLDRNLDAFLDFALGHPRVYDYFFTQPRPGARRYPKDFEERKSPTFNVLADIVADAMRSGLFRKDDVTEVALAIAAQTQGLITLYRGGRFSLSEKEFRAQCKRSGKRLLNGLKAPKK